jgi:hypothetical protein
MPPTPFSTPEALCSRRGFLAAAGSTGAALLFPGAAAALGRLAQATEAAGAAVDSFRSRRDLAAPAIAVPVAATDTSPGLIFLSAVTGPGKRGPMIVDDRGGLVWFRPLDRRTAADFRVQRYRGAPVLTWWEGGITGGYGKGEYVIADAAYRTVQRVRAGNGHQGDLHEFRLTPQGTALLTIYEPLPFDLTPFGGPVDGTLLESIVQEVDVASGRVLFEWHARDHVGLDESYRAVGDGILDHFHANSVDVDSDGNLLVSGRHTWAVYKLDRRSGEIVWRLGGKKSDFELGPGADFYWQHDARRQPDGTISIFDDGAEPPEEAASRGIRLQVDENARKASLAAEYVHPDHVLASAMGSMQVLPDGGAFVGWGTVPGFSEFTPDGELRFDARLAGGGGSYRTYRFPWSGRPEAPPMLAVGGPKAKRLAYASWNGATEVRRWRLRGGASRRSLRPLGTVARNGFETAIRVPPGVAWVAADAVGAKGRVLGSSAPRRV